VAITGSCKDLMAVELVSPHHPRRRLWRLRNRPGGEGLRGKPSGAESRRSGRNGEGSQGTGARAGFSAGPVIGHEFCFRVEMTAPLSTASLVQLVARLERGISTKSAPTGPPFLKTLLWLAAVLIFGVEESCAQRRILFGDRHNELRGQK
jgi:hypothetical protein